MTATTTRTDWLLFIFLGFLWGSSFLFIKIGVEAGLPPFTLVMLRLLIGFGLLAIVVTAARERLPRDPRIYAHLFVMGAINIAVPFSLITFAEQHIDSTVTSVLNAAVPIFVLPIGAIFLRDEPLSRGRVVGVLLGFVGVAVLVGFDPAAAAGTDLLGAVAVIARDDLVRRRCGLRAAQRARPPADDPGAVPGRVRPAHHVRAGVRAGAAVRRCRSSRRRSSPSSGWACSGPGWRTSCSSVSWRDAGRAGTAVVAYLLPVFGVTLGVARAARAAGPRLLVGLALIVGGIALVNSRIGAGRFRPAPCRPPSPAPTGATTTESPPMRTDLRPEDLGDLLEQPLIAVLATRRKDDTVMLSPVWFEWRDGGINIWVPTVEGGKVGHVQRDPRVTVVVNNHEWPYKGFEIRGEATVSGDDFYGVLRRTGAPLRRPGGGRADGRRPTRRAWSSASSPGSSGRGTTRTRPEPG